MSRLIEIFTDEQKLIFQSNPDNQAKSSNSSDSKQIIKSFPISSSKYGLGQIEGSNCTPKGHHQIARKIGKKAKPGEIFKARMPTGEIYHPVLDKEKYQAQDFILTRILWLSGLEAGFNQGLGDGEYEGKNVDSFERFIYIHGTNHEDEISKAASIGCIRMREDDLIWLFNHSKVGDSVWIH